MEPVSLQASAAAKAAVPVETALLGEHFELKQMTCCLDNICRPVFFNRFGVCCLFLVSSSGGVINQNCTYIRNPGFPSAYSGAGSVAYTINKCSSGKLTLNNGKCGNLSAANNSDNSLEPLILSLELN